MSLICSGTDDPVRSGSSAESPPGIIQPGVMKSPLQVRRSGGAKIPPPVKEKPKLSILRPPQQQQQQQYQPFTPQVS